MKHDAQRASATRLTEWVDRAASQMEHAGLFFGHGTATARDEACWMASHVLDLAPDFDAAWMDEPLPAEAVTRLDRLLGKRIDSRKPLAYLVGEAWFAGLPFTVDAATLVPRTPLTELVVDGLRPWLDFDRPLRALDVGTGSGCIAVALAHHWPALHVDAVDISASALAVAGENARRHGVAERVELLESDVYSALDGRRYNLIVSNPPYVPESSMRSLPDEYRHEPALALAAGGDGLDIVRRLLAGAPDHLAPGGFMLLEVGEAQPAAERLLGSVEAIWLEFEHGGDGVVLLDRTACMEFRDRNVAEQ